MSTTHLVSENDPLQKGSSQDAPLVTGSHLLSMRKENNDSEKVPRIFTKLFYFICSSRAKRDRGDFPRHHEAQARICSAADAAVLTQRFEEIGKLYQEVINLLPAPPNFCTKSTCLEEKDISLKESALVSSLLSRKEEEPFVLSPQVSDYTVLCLTVLVPDCATMNLSRCFCITSLAMEYLARLSHLKQLNLSDCFKKR